ncbi:putative outer membrane protein [Pseudomonas aeruginosa]|nr:putative outer membrane protein [Pseudomonas aeruginosa]
MVIRVITPALNVELLPIQADSSGNFSLNLLSPTILTQLGLNITDILNLGSQISFNLVSTDSNGNDSAAYGITLTPNGLSLNIGQIDVNGTSGDDVLSGANGSSEHINGGDGSDLIFNVGTGDHVVAGNGNDTIQITATDFVSIDGGAGFDTLVLANGIDLDYNAVGVGTLSNLERIDLGKGDSGSGADPDRGGGGCHHRCQQHVADHWREQRHPERGGRGEYRYHATDQRHYLRRLHLRQYHPADRGTTRYRSWSDARAQAVRAQGTAAWEGEPSGSFPWVCRCSRRPCPSTRRSGQGWRSTRKYDPRWPKRTVQAPRWRWAKGGYYPSVTMSGGPQEFDFGEIVYDLTASQMLYDWGRVTSKGRQRQRDPAQAVRGGAGGARRCGAGYRRDLPRRACLGAPGGGGARTHPAPRRHPRDDPGARRRRLRRPQRAGSRQSGTVAGPGAVVAGEGQPAGRAQPVRDPGRPGARRPGGARADVAATLPWRPAIWRG